MMNSMAAPQGSTSHGAESTAQLLRAFLEAPNPASRNAALTELVSARRPDAIPPLVSALQGEDRARRAAAAEALGRLGDSAAVAPLISVLNVPDVNLRLKAITALGLLGDPRACEPLIPFLKDPMPAARMLAAEALGRLKNPAATDPLVEAMNHSHAEMRRHLASAQDSRVKSLAATSRAQADEEWVFQWAIASALAGVGAPKAGSAIVAWAHRVFTSDVRRISADDKSRLVRDVADQFFRKQDKTELYGLLNRLQAQVKIQSWQRLSSVTETYDWIDASKQNPIWIALQDELARRTAAVVSLPIDAAEPANGAGVGAPVAPYFSAAPSAESMVPLPISSPRPAAPPTPPSTPLPADSRGAAPVASNPAPPKASSGLDATLDELMSLMGGSAKPKAAPAPAAPAVPKAPEGIPAPDPRVAELMALLKANDLRSLVAVGGAIRDAVAGRKPRDLDLTLQITLGEQEKNSLSYPELWNAQFVKLALESLQKLAALISCTMTDLICGRAVFRAKDGLLPVHYVGPFVLERTERRRTRESSETVVRRVFSRCGLVADTGSGRLLGPLPTATISDMWLDCELRSLGNHAQALKHLFEKTLELSGERSGDGAGWPEFAHLLSLKLELGGEPGPQARRAMETIARTVAADPAARGEFDSADLERFRAAVGGAPEDADAAIRRELQAWGLKEFAFGG